MKLNQSKKIIEYGERNYQQTVQPLMALITKQNEVIKIRDEKFDEFIVAHKKDHDEIKKMISDLECKISPIISWWEERVIARNFWIRGQNFLISTSKILLAIGAICGAVWAIFKFAIFNAIK